MWGVQGGIRSRRLRGVKGTPTGHCSDSVQSKWGTLRPSSWKTEKASLWSHSWVPCAWREGGCGRAPSRGQSGWDLRAPCGGRPGCGQAVPRLRASAGLGGEGSAPGVCKLPYFVTPACRLLGSASCDEFAQRISHDLSREHVIRDLLYHP